MSEYVFAVRVTTPNDTDAKAIGERIKTILSEAIPEQEATIDVWGVPQ